MIDRDGKYVIRGCLRGADSFHDFEDRCVRRLDPQAEQALRKASEKVGNELAKEWNAKRIGAGQCLLVQNSDPTADGHQLWCCRTVNCEIRLKLSGADEPKVLARAQACPRQSHVAAVRPNAQQLQQAEAQRKAAQTVFSVHTRSELKARRLCHHDMALEWAQGYLGL